MTAVVIGYCEACGQPLKEERDPRLKPQPTDVERDAWWPLPGPPRAMRVSGQPSWLYRHSALYRYFKGG